MMPAHRAPGRKGCLLSVLSLVALVLYVAVMVIG